jgi:hypothetical protein
MTTFTSDDREEEYKKIVEAAPYQPGYEDAVPITSPPHIVDSGASLMEMNANELADKLESFWLTKNDDLLAKAVVMIRQQQAEISLLQEYVCQLESGLDSSINLNKAQAERQAKTITDEEIYEIGDDFVDGANDEQGYCEFDRIGFARAILRKAQEK